MAEQKHKLIIIGSGPAGLTAAIYAARADLAPLLIGGKTPGGQLMQTTEVENFPGFIEGIMGPDLMHNMTKQAERFGTQIQNVDVTSVDFSKQPFIIKTDEQEYHADSVIIATGATAKWLGLESEEKFKGRGVSSCATCDGAFFRDKKVYVVGGGDSAMEEADFLTKFASSVTVLVRGDSLKASKIMQARVEKNPKAEILFNTEVKEVLGETTMTGLKLWNNKEEQESEVEGSGLFVAIGHKPNTGIFKDYLETNEIGYLVVKDQTKSSIPGVFIAGDVHDYRYRQAISAAGSGCMAAIDAEKYLAELEGSETIATEVRD